MGERDDGRVIDLLALQWRNNRREKSSVQPLTATGQLLFIEESYEFAREALRQLEQAGVELVIRDDLVALERLPEPGTALSVPARWDPVRETWITGADDAQP